MRHIRRAIVPIAILLFSGVAHAQSDDAAGNVTALSRHITEMRDLLDARDPSVRDAAVETALHDSSPAVRGLAIYYALRRYERLPLEFDLPSGSSVPRQALPSLVMDRVQWTPDGRSMTANSGSCGGWGTTGQVTGDRLRLQFHQICISSDALATVSNRPGAAPHSVPFRDCQAEMGPNQARSALTGILHCTGLSIELPLSLPLG